MSGLCLAAVPLFERYRAALKLAGQVDDVAMREQLLAAALWPKAAPLTAGDDCSLEEPGGQFAFEFEAVAS